MKRRRWSRLRQRLAGAACSLAVLGMGTVAQADEASPPAAPTPVSPPVVYTPILPAPADRPPPIANPPAPAAPVDRPPPVANPAILPAPADRPPPVVYTPILSAPADRPPQIPVAAPSVPAAASPREEVAVVETEPLTAPAPRSRRLIGVMTDLGVPDGANLGLVVRPAAWLHLHAAGGTNSVSLGFRGGATAIPHWFWHFGPSLTVEAGYCRVGNVNQVLRTFFQVPAWMKDYVQQAGYAYYNAHLGIEFGRGNVTGFIHAGGSYVDGTVRTPNAVSVATGTNSPAANPPQVILGQDATVRVYTPSAKVGLIVYFGGP